MSARVVVSEHGEQFARPRDFFARNPELVAYARRVRERGLRALSFLWADDGRIWRCDAEAAGPGAVLHAEAVDAPYGLTPRELQVLTLIAGGLTNADICARLHTSRRTTATHVEHILAKLGQKTRSGAVAMALGHDLLVLPLPAGTALDDLPIAALAAADRAPARPVRRRPIRLGSVYPRTGTADGDGQAMRRGAALAVEEINAHGGVAGRPLEHLPLRVDTTEPGAALRAVDHLLDAGVDAITFGHLTPSQQIPALERAAALGAPVLNSMVSPAVSERVRADPHRLGRTFQVSATEDAYVAGFIRSVTRLRDSGEWRPRNRRLLPILRDTIDGARLAGPLSALAERHGWRIADVVPIPHTDADWPRVLTAIRRADPAAVLITTYLEDELLAFLRAFAADPAPALLHGVWSPSVPGFLARAGAAAEGLVWSTVIGTYADELGLAFTRRYRRRYDSAPGRASAGIHYDLTHLLAHAWGAAATPWDYAEVARALRRSVHRGVAGAYYLDGEHRRGLTYPDDTRDASLAHAHLVYQVQQGRNRIIGPDEHATARFVPPGWLASVR